MRALVRRGMSLIEVLVAMVLSSLLLGLLINFYLTTLQISSRCVTRARLQQTGLTVLLELTRDLQRANAGGITFRPDESGQLLHCLIHPIDDVSAEGVPVYSDQDLMHYRFDPESRKLVRRAFSGSYPSPIALKSGEPMRFSPSEIVQLEQAGAAEKHHVEIRDFHITTPGVDPGYVGNPLRIQVIMEVQATGSTPPELVECLRSVVLRNSL